VLVLGVLHRGIGVGRQEEAVVDGLLTNRSTAFNVCLCDL
jgi:hypothetical protein